MSAVCRRCATPLEAFDLRCAICGLASEVALAPPERALARVLRCAGCGAAVSYEVEVGAPKCGFCGEVMHVEQPTDPVEQAEWIVPFQVPEARASEALRAWMRTLGFFRPKDLASEARVHGLVPLAWAAWVVDADAHVSFAADSDAGSGRSAWAPHAGEASMTFERVVVSASRGLAPDEVARLVPHYDLAPAVPAASAPPGGPPVERFDVQRSAARRVLADALEATARERVKRGLVPGSTFRNVHVAVLLRALTTRRIALPAYVLAYRYRDRTYRAIVHGQDPSCVFGDAPIAWTRVAAVILGIGALLLLLTVAVALLVR